jgi:hypothetical protein
VESGFAALPWPAEARDRYLDENTQGWRTELNELRAYAIQVAAHRDR